MQISVFVPGILARLHDIYTCCRSIGWVYLFWQTFLICNNNRSVSSPFDFRIHVTPPNGKRLLRGACWIYGVVSFYANEFRRKCWFFSDALLTWYVYYMNHASHFTFNLPNSLKYLIFCNSTYAHAILQLIILVRQWHCWHMWHFEACLFFTHL